MATIEINGTRVFITEAPIDTEADAIELVSAAFDEHAEWVAVDAANISAEFFRLASGLAGAVVQKLVNYHVCLAVIGDISAYVAASKSLHDYVWEANRGRHVWFVADLEELTTKLGGKQNDAG